MKDNRISLRAGQAEMNNLEEIRKHYVLLVGMQPSDSELIRFAITMAAAVAKGVYR